MSQHPSGHSTGTASSSSRQDDIFSSQMKGLLVKQQIGLFGPIVPAILVLSMSLHEALEATRGEIYGGDFAVNYL